MASVKVAGANESSGDVQILMTFMVASDNELSDDVLLPATVRA